MEALLEAAAFPDDGICQMTFNFWARVSNDLTTSFSPAGSQARSLAAAVGLPSVSALEGCKLKGLLTSWPMPVKADGQADRRVVLSDGQARQVVSPARAVTRPHGQQRAARLHVTQPERTRLPRSALSASGRVQAQPAVETLRPAFARLVGLIQRRVRFPDTWREMDREERQDFKAGRQAIGDTLMHAAGVPAAGTRPALPGLPAHLHAGDGQGGLCTHPAGALSLGQPRGHQDTGEASWADKACTQALHRER